MKNVCGFSEEAYQIYLKNVNGDEGDWGITMETQAAIHGALQPGADVDSMNRTMFRQVAKSLNRIDLNTSSGHTRVKLMKWLREIVTDATTTAAYGPENPYHRREVYDAFW